MLAAWSLLLVLALTPARVLAGAVTLAWDPVSHPDLAGYTLHYGPSAGNYTDSIDVGNRTQGTVANLFEGSLYHFAVTAYGFSGASSGYSNDVAAIISSGVASVETVEFHHAEFDHYFITGIADEITKLDDGTLAGWARTGHAFKAYAPGSSLGSGVCRFFSTSFGSRSSHFYTPAASECETVQGNADWLFEGEVFRIPVPSADGSCAAGTLPIYRLYNDGQGGAPNHRYTASPDVRAQMLAQGWIAEGYGPLGVVMCSPR